MPARQGDNSNSVEPTASCSYFSRAKKQPYHFEWKIDHFNLLYSSIKSITSPPFPPGNENQHQFVIQIHPETEKVLINSDGQTKPVCVIKFDLIFKHEIHEYFDYSLSLQSNIRKYQFRQFHGILKDNKLVYSTKIPVEDLIATFHWRNYQQPQPLTIICDICVLSSIQDFQKDPALKNEEDLGFLQHKSSVLETEEFKDFVFFVGNKKFHVHKVLLALESPVFTTMFVTNMNENMTASAEINDVEPEVFDKMLQFIYYKKIDEESFKNSVYDLLHLAHKYEIKQLELSCVRFLYKELSVDNVVKILYTAELYGFSELKERALVCLKFNLDAIKDSEEFKKLINRNPNVAADLVRIETGPNLNETCMGTTQYKFKRSGFDFSKYCCCCFTYFINKWRSPFTRFENE